ATGRHLPAIAEEAPERGRAILAEVMGPLTLTPKEERPERFIEASGSVDLAKVAAVFANGSSGGRI
ncbi:MAG: hypothetical protein AB7O24_27650, partial [Kofleriaceae bacterium]